MLTDVNPVSFWLLLNFKFYISVSSNLQKMIYVMHNVIKDCPFIELDVLQQQGKNRL